MLQRTAAHSHQKSKLTEGKQGKRQSRQKASKQYLTQVVMFTLNPSGSSSSSSSSSGWGGIKAQFSFFGKLVTYFVALRLVHVYWGDSPPKAIEN
eukprot:scaffold5766_cov64-Cyclotella_meneghiniana.AAC.5